MSWKRVHVVDNECNTLHYHRATGLFCREVDKRLDHTGGVKLLMETVLSNVIYEEVVRLFTVTF